MWVLYYLSLFMPYYWVNFRPLAVKAKDVDTAIDLAKERCGTLEVDEVEEDEYIKDQADNIIGS